MSIDDENRQITRKEFLELKNEISEINTRVQTLHNYITTHFIASSSAQLGGDNNEHSYQNDSTSDGELHEGELEYRTRQDNPLLIDLVLQEMFTMVSFKDLKNCRLVCKKWRNVSTKEMRCRNRIEFNYSSTKTKYTKNNKMTKYIGTSVKSEESICDSFSFICVPMGAFVTRKFFESCGRSVRRLSLSLKEPHINIGQFNDLLISLPFLEDLEIRDLPESVTTVTEAVLPNQTQDLPRLKKITIDYWNVFSVEFLSQLFRRAQYLNELRIGLLDEEAVDKVMAALLLSANAERLIKISTDSLGKEDFVPLVKLSKKNMKLKSLKISNMPDQDCQSFLEFLNYQKDTLEFCALENYGPKNLALPLPQMKNLKSLKISFNQIDIPPINQSIKFGNQFPYLTLLEIEMGGIDAVVRADKWHSLFPYVENPTQLKSLRELKFVKFEEPIILKRVAKRFPQVKKLQLEFFSNEEELLRTLWNLWGETLEELYLEPSRAAIENVDAVFCGISPEDCNQILHEDAFDFADLEEIRIGPSICNLKMLRILIIKYEKIPRCYRDNHYFSNVTAYFALAHLRHLKKVFIEPSKITADCVKNISIKIPDFRSRYI